MTKPFVIVDSDPQFFLSFRTQYGISKDPELTKNEGDTGLNPA